MSNRAINFPRRDRASAAARGEYHSGVFPLSRNTASMSPLRRLYRTLCIVLVLATGAATAFELQAPASSAQDLASPRVIEDPARPADAPTTLAIQAALDEGSAANARTLAERALLSSRAAYGPRDPRTLPPLINLAHARQQAGEVAAALADYRAAIEIAEASGGPRDKHLFDAWYGTGYAHLQAGEALPATDALATALQVHRVNSGLYSAQQIEVLHALALAHRATGKPDLADELQYRRALVADRVFSPGAPQRLQTFLSVARWYREQGRIGEAVTLQAAAVKSLEESGTREDPRLIDPLLELVQTAAMRRIEPDERPLPIYAHPATSLSRAERIADAQPGQSPAAKAQTLIRIADVNLATGRRESAYALYARAEALLAQARMTSPLTRPSFISFRPPAAESPKGSGSGFVLAEFSVDRQGRTRDVRIVESMPKTLTKELSARLTSALREARLRPRIHEGKPVESAGVRYRLPVREGSA